MQCIVFAGGSLFAASHSTVDHVLEISLQEEEVHSKLTETERAIDKLQTLLNQTQEQLSRRLHMKEKVRHHFSRWQ